MGFGSAVILPRMSMEPATSHHSRIAHTGILSHFPLYAQQSFCKIRQLPVQPRNITRGPMFLKSIILPICAYDICHGPGAIIC